MSKVERVCNKEVRKENRQEKKKARKIRISTSKLAKLVFDIDDNVKSFVTNNYKSSNKIHEINDVVYYPAEADICNLDLFRPELVADVKLPVIINVHGGGWVTGDKRWRVAQGKLFADMGTCVINLNYGLSPKYRFHQSLRHVFLALRWLQNNAEEYKLDLDNVFIMGDSAGGQIACQVCAVLHNKEFLARLGVEPLGFSIKGALLNCGAYDFDDLFKNPMATDIIKDMTGKELSLIDEYEYKDMLYTIPWISDDFPKRVFVSYGKNDMFVGRHHTALLKRLDELGKLYVTYCGTFPGLHCFHLFYKTSESQAMYVEAKKYLMETVRGQEESSIV